ncbi:hypothetical protein [Bacteroides sp. UBA939]|uniref:hypothetical protein n=1 Tax=Bacteroides sp. UBA939 TaxID=1946092 RepID=UPI0025BB620A|nr:hypothetical protein [Bacteroides sp. UBA939]
MNCDKMKTLKLSLVIIGFFFIGSLSVTAANKSNRVRQLIEREEWGGAYREMQYTYDTLGNVRMRIFRTRKNMSEHPVRVGDTVFYDAEGRQLSKVKPSAAYPYHFKVFIDRIGKSTHINETARLIQSSNIAVIKKDDRDNWIEAKAYNPRDKEQKYSSTLVWRFFEYWGDNPDTDKAIIEKVAEMNVGIDKKIETGNALSKLIHAIESVTILNIIIMYMLVPFIIVTLCYGIWLYIFAHIRVIPNWVLTLGSLFGGIPSIQITIEIIESYGAYDSFLGIVAIWIITLGMGLGMYYGVVHQRCPRCHQMRSSVFERLITKRRVEERRRDTNELLSASTSTDVDERHICHNCGYDWWTNEL